MIRCLERRIANQVVLFPRCLRDECQFVIEQKYCCTAEQQDYGRPHVAESLMLLSTAIGFGAHQVENEHLLERKTQDPCACSCRWPADPLENIDLNSNGG
jgi:hypothetical protein